MSKYTVVEKAKKPHTCKLPGLFAIWNQDLEPGTIIECTECKSRWVRCNRDFRWCQFPLPVESIPKPPTGPGGMISTSVKKPDRPPAGPSGIAGG